MVKSGDDRSTPVVAIVGWKNSGKTTLTVRLVEELTRRGWRIATIKHAHHNFQIDDAGTDSSLHRRAGAREVVIVSARRWAIVHELLGEPEPNVSDVITFLAPADLIIIEGYKSEPIPKIEVRRNLSVSKEPLAATDPLVIAIVADHAVVGNGRPVFTFDDISPIASFLEQAMALGNRRS
jgi:molybdopterin-guanine dinucleotide biosynthesis protein B